MGMPLLSQGHHSLVDMYLSMELQLKSGKLPLLPPLPELKLRLKGNILRKNPTLPALKQKKFHQLQELQLSPQVVVESMTNIHPLNRIYIHNITVTMLTFLIQSTTPKPKWQLALLLIPVTVAEYAVIQPV